MDHKTGVYLFLPRAPGAGGWGVIRASRPAVVVATSIRVGVVVGAIATKQSQHVLFLSPSHASQG
jgi:hypothetical protein